MYKIWDSNRSYRIESLSMPMIHCPMCSLSLSLSHSNLICRRCLCVCNSFRSLSLSFSSFSFYSPSSFKFWCIRSFDLCASVFWRICGKSCDLLTTFMNIVDIQQIELCGIKYFYLSSFFSSISSSVGSFNQIFFLILIEK